MQIRHNICDRYERYFIIFNLNILWITEDYWICRVLVSYFLIYVVRGGSSDGEEEIKLNILMDLRVFSLIDYEKFLFSMPFIRIHAVDVRFAGF
jgi:hypothetical protein